MVSPPQTGVALGVALLVFSHYHLDHVGGIVGVFHGRTVDQVVTGPLALPAGGVELVHSVLATHHLTIGAAPVGRTVHWIRPDRGRTMVRAVCGRAAASIVGAPHAHRGAL